MGGWPCETFISIDLYEKMSTDLDYINKTNGNGGEGIVSGTMQGDHLAWFEQVLKVAREDLSSINHIIVQAHMPVQEPVRTVNSSSMKVDDGENSEFWKLMVKYNVDLYLAGEVHSTTASKDANSNLIQIVSRGNRINNFLKIEVEDEVLRVQHYNEIGSKPSNNNNYEQNGQLIIDKSGSDTKIESDGALQILDLRMTLIRYNFEEVVPLGSRQVPALLQMEGKNRVGLIANTTDMRGITCSQALPNLTSFGRK